jgi:hypothetical protein
MLELVHLMFDLLQTTESRERRLMDRRAGLEVHVLVQQTELYAAGANNVAAIRGVFTSDETEDGALAGAVSAYQSGVLSRINLQRRASQHVLSAIGLMYF